MQYSLVPFGLFSKCMLTAFLLPVNAEPQGAVELPDSAVSSVLPRPLSSPAQAEAAAAALVPRLFAQAA